MTKFLFLSLLIIGMGITFAGCSEREPIVVEDVRTEAEIQAGYDNYDKKMAGETYP